MPEEKKDPLIDVRDAVFLVGLCVFSGGIWIAWGLAAMMICAGAILLYQALR